MHRTAAITALLILLIPGTAATGIGVTPDRLDLGTHAPGDTFTGTFNVLATGNTSVTVDFDAGTGTMTDFRRLGTGVPDRFSAQPCPECITFLRGEGVIRERDRRIQNTARWNAAQFLVRIPPDIEPGYHLLTVTPQPSRRRATGSVGMVATTSIPVVFRVPGKATRAGMVLGVHRGEMVGDTQELVTRFYNNGTVTVSVTATFRIETGNTTRIVPAGTRTVAPDTTTTFTAAAPRRVVNQSTVTAVADYGTGTAAATAPFARERPVVARHPFDAVWPLLVLLAATSIVTWRVVLRG